MNDFLYTYSEDSYSENGEDGINKKILEHLGINEGVILEIGAWDGFFASNCANLWSKNKNFNNKFATDKTKLFKFAYHMLS